MAKFTIHEIWEFAKTEDPETIPHSRGNLLFARYEDAPLDPDTHPDLRPEWIKLYVNTNGTVNKVVDEVIASKYGEYLFLMDCDTVADAFAKFTQSNYVYCILHNAELGFIYKSYTDDFEPRENYDRHEDTTVYTNMLSGATTKTAPDDSETFFNVGNADSSTNGDVRTDGHIHGNIGVVDAPTMAKNVINVFGGTGWIDYFVDRLIKDNCILIDYGNNAF